jgi:hypothetical protein
VVTIHIHNMQVNEVHPQGSFSFGLQSNQHLSIMWIEA